MLAVYEQLPDYFANFQLNIPESGDATPDLLDELMFNIKWMFTMQDPADGGVYHKLTTPNFEGFVMPIDCHQTRYVVKKSVTAAYDFAAVMAKAARAYKQVPAYKDFPAAAVRAAKAAFEWAKAHPADFYHIRISWRSLLNMQQLCRNGRWYRRPLHQLPQQESEPHGA